MTIMSSQIQNSLLVKRQTDNTTVTTPGGMGLDRRGLVRSFHKSRRNISIGIPIDLFISTEMTSIEPLVENEISSKTPKKLKIMLCHIFLTDSLIGLNLYIFQM